MARLNLPKNIHEIVLPKENILDSFPNHDAPKSFIILTDKRLILYRGGLFSYSYESLQYSKITSVNFVGGLLYASCVTITEGTLVFEMKSYNKEEVRKIVNCIRKMIEEPEEPKEPEILQNPPLPQEPEILHDELEIKLLKLKDFMDKGLITEEEYKAKKKELLNLL